MIEMKSFGIKDVISTCCHGRVLRIDPATGSFPPGTDRIALLLGGECLMHGAEPAVRIVQGYLTRLTEAGYQLTKAPRHAEELAPILGGVSFLREDGATLAFNDYALEYGRLPPHWREAVEARWGTPEQDRRYLPGRTDCGQFALPVVEYGDVAIGILSADRGPVPRHWELALAFWLSLSFRAETYVFVDDGFPGEDRTP
jgi:hypothetical protein